MQKNLFKNIILIDENIAKSTLNERIRLELFLSGIKLFVQDYVLCHCTLERH